MLTTTPIPENIIQLGRGTTLQPDQLYVEIAKQQQVAANVGSFLSTIELNHWVPADGTALVHGLIASFSVILVSELGDKTFIITAIMAMKNSRFLVFLASALALFMMTVLSVGMGVAVTVIPKLYTHYASIVLFFFFGLKMLHEAYVMGGEVGESEFDEVKRSLEEREEKIEDVLVEKDKAIDSEAIISSRVDEVSSNDSTSYFRKIISSIYVAPIVINVFTMVFVAEWGDRSQISTVILAAREDVVGVFVGSFCGHILCTGLAVIGGRFIAEIISVRTMTLIGGIIFLFFAVSAIISGPE